MSEPLHTKAPWRSGRFEGEYGSHIAIGGLPIGSRVICDVHPGPEQEANAELFLAAPELLEIAKDLMSFASGDALVDSGSLVSRAKQIVKRVEGLS